MDSWKIGKIMPYQPDYSINQDPDSLSKESGGTSDPKSKHKNARAFYNSRSQHGKSASLKGIAKAISKKR